LWFRDEAAFNAAFPMFAGMSYVLEEALVEVYAELIGRLEIFEDRKANRRPKGRGLHVCLCADLSVAYITKPSTRSSDHHITTMT
jgi:hypothetical protein